VNGNVSARGLVKGAGNEVERRVELLSLLPQHGERTMPGNWGPRKGRQAGRAATQFPRLTIDINHQPVELQAVKELLIVGELSVLSCPVLGVNKFSLCFVAAHALVSWLALLLAPTKDSEQRRLAGGSPTRYSFGFVHRLSRRLSADNMNMDCL